MKRIVAMASAFPALPIKRVDSADTLATCASLGPRQHQGYVVGLLFVADPVVDGGSDNFGDALKRQMAIVEHQLNQPLLSELPVIVFRLRHSIAVGDQQIAATELYRRLRKTQVVEQADDGSAAAQELRRPILGNQNRRQVAAIAVGEAARGPVIDSQEQSRVLCVRS